MSPLRIYMCMSKLDCAEIYLLRTKDLLETKEVSNDVELIAILQYLGTVSNC